MNIKTELETKLSTTSGIYLNNIEIDPPTIKAIMINEVVPSDPIQDFYGAADADYLKTTIPLFQMAGAKVTSIQDILQKGIYITNAVKTPKSEYNIDKGSIENSLPYLETAGTAFFFDAFFVIMLKAFFATSPISIITFTLGNNESSASR